MEIINWLNTNDGSIIGIATVVLVIVTGYYAYLTRRLLKTNDTTVTIHIYPNNNLLLKVLENAEEVSAGNHSQLSVDERMVLLDELADKFMEYVGPDFPPLSDYAVSREGIYEDHP